MTPWGNGRVKANPASGVVGHGFNGADSPQHEAAQFKEW